MAVMLVRRGLLADQDFATASGPDNPYIAMISFSSSSFSYVAAFNVVQSRRA